MALSWRHHALIQSLLSRGPLSEEEVHSIFSDVSGRNAATHGNLFNDFLLKINKELAYVQFEIRGCRNQYDGKVFYGVVNNVSDEQSKLGTKYSVPQLAFYKAILEAISQDMTCQGYIQHIDALNLRLDTQAHSSQSTENSQSQAPYAFRSFTISLKEKTLSDLIQDKWLCSTLDGKIGLGVRSFLDLRSWFRSNDIPSCDVCNEAGVKAVTCPNENCTIRIHEYCSRKKFSKKKAPRVCPGCGADWHPPEGNEGQESEDEKCESPQAPVASSSAARRRIKAGAAKAAKASQAQGEKSQPPSGPSLRKRPGSCKIEAEDITHKSGSLPHQNRSPERRRTRRSMKE